MKLAIEIQSLVNGFNSHKENKMLIDITKFTDDEINETVNRSCAQSIPVMYLENNGQKEHEWVLNNFKPWLNEDLDD